VKKPNKNANLKRPEKTGQDGCRARNKVVSTLYTRGRRCAAPGEICRNRASQLQTSTGALIRCYTIWDQIRRFEVRFHQSAFFRELAFCRANFLQRHQEDHRATGSSSAVKKILPRIPVEGHRACVTVLNPRLPKGKFRQVFGSTS